MLTKLLHEPELLQKYRHLGAVIRCNETARGAIIMSPKVLRPIKYKIVRKGDFSVPLWYLILVFSEDFDSEKSEWTVQNRGISFVAARKVWQDVDAIEGPGNSVRGEERWIKVGLIDSKLWTVVFTYRAGLIRVISVRPARKDEKDAYYG